VINEPLDGLYFEWLYRQVADPNLADPSLTYWKLFKVLFETEFQWFIPHDDNRLLDGKELRVEFLHDQHLEAEATAEWTEIGCSMLELMIGLARRLSFEAERQPFYWFWVMAKNVGIQQYSDDWRLPVNRIKTILDKVINREYEPTGRGGFFPLKNPKRDQRQVELWYQLSAYVLELD
jgi:hypothetical protein